MNTVEFLNRFHLILAETWKLVKRKNEQYSTNDALANFTTGAELQYHDKSPEWQFEALKDYMLKHVAHIYNNPLMGNGVRESLGDIATYCIIGMIMHDSIDTRQPEPEEKEPEAQEQGFTDEEKEALEYYHSRIKISTDKFFELLPLMKWVNKYDKNSTKIPKDEYAEKLSKIARFNVTDTYSPWEKAGFFDLNYEEQKEYYKGLQALHDTINYLSSIIYNAEQIKEISMNLRRTQR